MSKRFSLAFNWRNSPPHMLFLQTFLKARPVDEHPALPNDSSWHALLEELPEQAIKRFLAQGALTKVTLAERLDFHFKASELKEMARQRLSCGVVGSFLSGRMAPPELPGGYGFLTEV